MPVGVKNASYLPYAGACYDDKFSTGINSFGSNNKFWAYGLLNFAEIES